MLEILSDTRWGGVAAITAILSTGVAIWQYFHHRKGSASGAIKIASDKAGILSLADRFLLAFKAHEIEPAQIPRYIPDLALADLARNDKLIAALDHGIIAETCQRFNLRQDWLEGKNVPIYPRPTFYKQLDAFVDFIAEITSKHKYIRGFAIKFHDDKLKKEGPYDLPIVLLFAASIDDREQSTGEPIWRYFIINDQYSWGYWKARCHIKAMTYIAHAFGVHTFGCQLNRDDICQLLAGKTFPGPLLEGISHVAWYPEDYMYIDGESAALKDPDEAVKVQEWLDKQGVFRHLVDHVERVRLHGNKINN